MSRAALALALGLVVGCGGGRAAVIAADRLPADARLVDGGAPFIAAERYHGKVVVLDFWAGWCLECRRTIPQVRRLAAAFSPDELIVVGVNAGERAEDAAKAAQELGIDYPIALDPELAFSDRLGAGNLPVLLVIDRDGAVAHRTRHVDPETLAVIRRLVAAKPR